jgi:hypothetical protein
MYGRGAGAEGKAEDKMLAAQMAQAKAPYEAHTKAVDDLIRMQESRGKLMAGMQEKKFEYGMKEKLNQDRIRASREMNKERIGSSEQMNKERLAARGETDKLTESQLLHAAYEAEQARQNAVDTAIKINGPKLSQAELTRIGEAAFRRRLGPYYDQVMAASGGGGGSFASGPVAGVNSQTRGLVVPGKFTPMGQ